MSDTYDGWKTTEPVNPYAPEADTPEAVEPVCDLCEVSPAGPSGMCEDCEIDLRLADEGAFGFEEMVDHMAHCQRDGGRS